MDKNTKKIAYTGVLTAISIIMILIAVYLPFSFAPFLVCSLIIYYLMSKCGVVFTLIHIAAVALLSLLFFFGQFYLWLPYLIMFAPHAFIIFYLNKMKANNYVVLYIIRYAILLVFFNLSLFAVYKLASTALFDMDEFISIVGGYFVLALIMNVAFILYDQVFMYLYNQLVKLKILQ